MKLHLQLLWLDTESDGFHGRLLSIGIVSADEQFYAELPAADVQCAWTRANVVPHLAGATHMNEAQLAHDLTRWLRRFEAVEVIADWHQDLVHFFRLLGPTPGEQLATPPVQASLKTWLNGAPSPFEGGPRHHALHDARRIMAADLAIT